MRSYIYFFLLGIIISCSGQEIPKNVDGFADQNYLPTSKANAKYYRIHQSIGDIPTLSVNPNANPNTGQILPDEYGSAYSMVPSGVKYHAITFYNFKNQKVLEASALAYDNTYELYNMAIWYDPQGNKKEVGFFKDNKRVNLYEIYDKNGNIIKTGYYVNGKKFTNYHVDQRLVGKWVSKISRPDGLGGEIPEKLFNELSEDGVMQIWTEPDVEDDWFDGLNEPDIIRMHSSFKKTGPNTGILSTIDYFTGNVDKEIIKFIDNNTFTSTITKHSEPSLNGITYTFYRVQ